MSDMPLKMSGRMELFSRAMEPLARVGVTTSKGRSERAGTALSWRK